GRADAGSGRNLLERALRSAPRVTRIAARQDGREREIRRVVGRQVLGRVHGDVDLTRSQRILELRAENAAPTELGEAVSPVAIADGRDRDDRDRAEPCVAKRVGGDTRLTAREARPPRTE